MISLEFAKKFIDKFFLYWGKKKKFLVDVDIMV